jgi:hypothetical protein
VPFNSASDAFQLHPDIRSYVAVNDGGAEGSTDDPTEHYPISASQATQVSSTARVRRMGLTSASPLSGPSTGATEVTIVGDGFEAPMTCDFYRDSTPTSTTATVVNSTHLTCVTPTGSGKVTTHVTFADACALSFDFVYYTAPEVLAVSPGSGPRFGATAITVYATNLYFLSQYPSYTTPKCSLGQAGDAEVGSASYRPTARASCARPRARTSTTACTS